MNKWERRDGKVNRRSRAKFKQPDDVNDSYTAKVSAKKISKLKKRWAQEVQDIVDIDDDVI